MEIQERLLNFYDENKERIADAPPKALILNGWVYSTDYQKKLRWEETIKWAEDNGCKELIPEIEQVDRYVVDKIEETFIQSEDPYGFDENEDT